jgi:type II secretory pathway component GspD/PulD (secretin)
VTKATPVAASLRDVTLAAALRAVLSSAGCDRDIDFGMDEGVIAIGPARDFRMAALATRVYDIRDLVIAIPDFDDTPNGVVSTKQPTRAQLADSIIQLIRDSIDASHWNDADDANHIRELSGQLIVTAPLSVQEQIASLLSQLRETRAVQVSLEMRFVTVDPQKLPRAIADQLGPNFDQARATRSVFLTEDQTRDLIHQAQKNTDSTMLTAPRITLFNGQRAFVRVQTQQSYVSGYKLAKSDDGKKQLEPTVDQVTSGIALDTWATASADRKSITVTLHPTLSQLTGLVPHTYKVSPDDTETRSIQIPSVISQSIQTTASVPDRQTLLISGLVSSRNVEGRGQVTQPMFLLVKPSLLVQKEVASATAVRP